MASAADVANRVPITVGLMLATVMNSLDITIANVALPHIQGSVSASQDQITWVLTSYIVASAIMTPLTGWFAARFGRKLTFLASIVGFTGASMLCGVSNSLLEIVGFRFVQGLCGAAMAPLSQATLLDTFPPSQVGQVMSIWSMGTVLGPMLGPMIGGWLTDNFTWRWVFFINLPVGILAFAALWFFMSGARDEKPRRFDFFGYGTLVVFVIALQLMLDRGSTLDWFSSREIWAETLIAAVGLYLFIIHSMTTDRPFFDRALMHDRNFVSSNVFGFFIGILLFSTMSLTPPLMQGLLGYTVFGAGALMMPRGIGSFIGMFIVGRVVGRVDTRLIVVVGLSLSCVALFQMTHFNLEMSSAPFVVSGAVQGLGLGMIFVPLTVTAFATLSPTLRSDGAAIFTLTRSIGSSVGISLMQAFHTREWAFSHADIAAQVQPNNPALAAGLPPFMNPMAPGGLEALNGEITRQSDMVAYLDVFRLMIIITIAVMPLLLFMRPPKHSAQHVEAIID